MFISIYICHFFKPTDVNLGLINYSYGDFSMVVMDLKASVTYVPEKSHLTTSCLQRLIAKKERTIQKKLLLNAKIQRNQAHPRANTAVKNLVRIAKGIAKAAQIIENTVAAVGTNQKVILVRVKIKKKIYLALMG